MRNFFEIFITIILAVNLWNVHGQASMSRPLSEEEIYLEKVERFPCEFVMTRTEADDAWARAQVFIARFSPKRLQIVTNSVIQTFKPMGCSDEYGYSIIKIPMGENVVISVECIPGNTLKWPYAKRNAHILAYYIKTGELPYPELIAR